VWLIIFVVPILIVLGAIGCLIGLFFLAKM